MRNIIVDKKLSLLEIVNKITKENKRFIDIVDGEFIVDSMDILESYIKISDISLLRELVEEPLVEHSYYLADGVSEAYGDNVLCVCKEGKLEPLTPFCVFNPTNYKRWYPKEGELIVSFSNIKVLDIKDTLSTRLTITRFERSCNFSTDSVLPYYGQNLSGFFDA